MLKLSLIPALLVAGVVLGHAAPASAQSYNTAIVTSGGNCLIPDSNRSIRVFPCSYGGARYNITDGRVRTSDGYCFDHSVGKGANFWQNNEVKLVQCHGGRSQQWYFMTEGPGRGLAQNAENPAVCLNIPSGNDRQGTQMVVWSCGYNRPATNESFSLGAHTTVQAMRPYMPPQDMIELERAGVVKQPSGFRLVAAGGGNLVAAGGGNLTIAAGGNLVAAGGGNLVAAGGGNMVSAGNSNAYLNWNPVQFLSAVISQNGSAK